MQIKTEIGQRNNVQVFGKGQRTLMMAHGFGCDQNMWRFLVPEFADDYRLVLFDYVGSGQSELQAFSTQRYGSLEGYARDVLDICKDLSLEDITFIGHSVSGTIGLIASLEAPERFLNLVMVCPSPCFLDFPPHYYGGFSREDLSDLIDLMDKNYIGWASYLAPLVMGPSSPEKLVGELSGSFCSTDPVVAKAFAEATFFSDHRHLLPNALHPVLILQSRNDSLADMTVGQYMHEHLPDSTFRVLDADGHCTHMTHPELVASAIRGFLSEGAEQ
jgi:sigma-B regulation protein RsbQ